MTSGIIQEDFSMPGGVPNTPFQIHPSVINRLDPKYVDFFEENLSDKPNLVYTHRVPLKAVKEGGNVIPGQSSPREMSKVFEVDIKRKFTKGPSKIPARVFIPKRSNSNKEWPLLIWFHGGGWVLGGLDTENSYCTTVADFCQMVVVTIDYRMAPQDPFPACVEDAFESVIWAMEEAPKQLNVDNTKICIGGSSAGGNLTAVVTHKYASSPLSKKLPPLKFQLLVVPVTDNTATTDTNISWRQNEFTPQLPAEKMLWYRYLYLPRGQDDYKNPEASPIFYSDAITASVPPCYVAACELDILRSEAEAYAEKLKKNGVATTINIYPRVGHTAMVMNAVLDQGKDLVKDTIMAIKEAIAS